MSTRRGGGPVAVVVVAALLALLAGGCTSDLPRDPDERLAQAARDTFASSFAFRFAARADEEALAGLGDVLGPVTARLNLLEISGTVDGPTTTVDVSVFGTAPLLQLRRYGDTEQYLRAGLGEGPLATLVGPTLRGRVDRLADALQLPDSVEQGLDALFEGQWIGVTGVFDAARLQQVLGGTAESTATATPAQAGTPFPDVVDTYLEVREEQQGDDEATYAVELRFRDLVRDLSQFGEDLSSTDLSVLDDALQGVPETVEGTVVSRGGRVEQVLFDVAEAARAAGEDVPGSIRLELAVTDHGDPNVPAPPDAAVVVPSDDLLEALARLMLTPLPQR